MSEVTTTPRESLLGYMIADRDFAVGFVYAQDYSADPAPVFWIPRKKLANGEVQEIDDISKEIVADLGKGSISRRMGTPCMAHVDAEFMKKIRAH